MSYFYIFTDSDYSEYEVTGLYTSEVKLTDLFLLEKKREMLSFIVPQVDEKTLDRLSEIDDVENLLEELYRLKTGKPVPDKWSGMLETLWSEINVNFTNYLITAGVIQKVPYTEVNRPHGKVTGIVSENAVSNTHK